MENSKISACYVKHFIAFMGLLFCGSIEILKHVLYLLCETTPGMV